MVTLINPHHLQSHSVHQLECLLTDKGNPEVTVHKGQKSGKQESCKESANIMSGSEHGHDY